MKNTIISGVVIALMTLSPDVIFAENKHAKDLANQAKQYQEKGDLKAAETLYFEAIKKSNELWIWIDLANFYDQTQQYEKVIKVTENKIRKDFPGKLSSIAIIHNRAVEALGTEKTKDIPLIGITKESNTKIESKEERERFLTAVMQTPTQDNLPRKPQIGSTSSVTGVDYSGDITGYCKKISEFGGGSYSLEEGCRRNETEARSELARMNVPPRIVKYCKEIADYGDKSYSLMLGCIRNELEAKSKL